MQSDQATTLQYMPITHGPLMEEALLDEMMK
jgi:hypothetical protein